MKPWIHEDILKTWTDAQKRLWESLCSAVPLQPPTGVEAWRETYLKNLASWEAAVRRSLEQEAAWVEEWVQRVAQEKGTPEMMASWIRQMEEVLQRWIQTQNHWWDDYFALLRRGGFAQPDQFGPQSAPAAEPVKTVESVPAAEPAPPEPPAATTTIQPSRPNHPSRWNCRSRQSRLRSRRRHPPLKQRRTPNRSRDRPTTSNGSMASVRLWKKS